MKQNIYSITLGAILLAASGLSSADSASDSLSGLWQTEKSENGYLHVSFEPCADKMCGSIVAAFNTEDEPGLEYEHLGKQMIWNMKAAGDNKWSKGKIWDPTTDKTFKSKMTLVGDKLEVSGCVVVFCKSQVWQKVPG